MSVDSKKVFFLWNWCWGI